MRQVPRVVAIIVLLNFSAQAAAKPHIVALGRWTSISFHLEHSESPIQLKIRRLYVDGRAKEFTTGPSHDVTERTFVVQRIYRVNDSLPQQSGPIQWRWQRGGWLIVDRVSGKIQPITLPEFDPDTSGVNWFRDYAAYCGSSDDGQKVFAVIVQTGRRKPLLKKAAGDTTDSEPACAPPVWERDPVRVTFEPKPGQKLTFAVKSRAVDPISPD
jgi:hypothetical protein